MIKNSRGFSLVSVMVAAGIAGGIALLIMQLSDNMKGIEFRTTSTMDSREILSEVRTILENEKNCKLSFRNEDGTPLTFYKKDIDEPGVDQGLPVELWLGNASGTERMIKKFDDGSELGRTTVKSIRLFMNNGTGANYELGPKSDLGLIKVTYFSKETPQKALIRDFLINLDFTTDVSGKSTIVGCERSGVKSMCESLNMIYSPETQKCLNPVDVCDDWLVVGETSNWSGWKEGACTRLDGGYVQSLKFSQSKNGASDFNGLSIKCCYSRKYENGQCETKEVVGTEWWTGTKDGLCVLRPRGIVRKVEFYQGVADGKDTNGMKVQCCYPQ